MSTRKKSQAMKYLEKVIGGPLTIGKVLVAVREGDDLSQVDFAKKLGISRANLCDMEKGRRFISEEMAERFAEKLGESKEQFVRLAIQDRLAREGLHYRIEVVAA